MKITKRVCSTVDLCVTPDFLWNKLEAFNTTFFTRLVREELDEANCSTRDTVELELVENTGMSSSVEIQQSMKIFRHSTVMLAPFIRTRKFKSIYRPGRNWTCLALVCYYINLIGLISPYNFKNITFVPYNILSSENDTQI